MTIYLFQIIIFLRSIVLLINGLCIYRKGFIKMVIDNKLKVTTVHLNEHINSYDRNQLYLC